MTPEHKAEVEAYVNQARQMTEIERMSTEKDKTGVFTGGYITNPVNGERVPVWIADYVLMGYGAGAIMGVPAHDQRDFEFARKFGIPIREVIRPEGEEPSDPATWTEAKEHLGVMVNSGSFDGVPAEEAIARITRFIENQGIGKFMVKYRLRDWLISRQRYWGTPIPIIYCPKDGMVPVPEDQVNLAVARLQCHLLALPDLDDRRDIGVKAVVAAARLLAEPLAPIDADRMHDGYLSRR